MRHFLLIIVSIFCLIGIASAQSMKELKKRQREAKQQIELTSKLLKENENKKSATASTLDLLQKQISTQEKLIKSLDKEISLLDNNLNVLGTEKKSLDTRLSALKADYANMVYHAHFSRNNYDKYLFLLSSQTINQAYHRLRYMQEYALYQKEQSIKIQEVVNQITQKEARMMQTINEKDFAKQEKEQEAAQLLINKDTQQEVLTELSRKEKKLRDDLVAQQKRANELNNKIQDLIAKEIAEAERKAKEKQRREAEEAAKAAAAKAQQQPQQSTKPSTTPAVTPPMPSTLTQEETLIAGGFEKNVGRLPWPTRGSITGHFGTQPHPVLQHVEVNNKGIYIQAEPGAEATAVYEGVVTQVFTIPGSNNAVIVKHGNYRTVYGNLTTPYVKVGSKVTAKQKLGKIFVDDDNNDKTELYFMLYKNSTVENPEKWLVK